MYGVHVCTCIYMYILCTNSILWRALAFSVNLLVSMGWPPLKGDKLPFQSLRVFERSYIWYCHRTIHLILFSNMGLLRHTQWLWGLMAEHIPGDSIPMASWGLATPRLGRVISGLRLLRRFRMARRNHRGLYSSR